MSKGGEQPTDWDSLVPQLIHPTRVAILEAITWMDRPLSAPMIARMVDEPCSVSRAAYHLRKLDDGGALETVYERRVCAGFERFYVLALAESQHGA